MFFVCEKSRTQQNTKIIALNDFKQHIHPNFNCLPRNFNRVTRLTGWFSCSKCYQHVFILMHSARNVSMISNVFIVVLYVNIYYKHILYECSWAAILMYPLH